LSFCTQEGTVCNSSSDYQFVPEKDDFPSVCSAAVAHNLTVNDDARFFTSLGHCFEDYLMVTCKFTVVRHAVAYHSDVPCNRQSITGTSFIENKMLFYDADMCFPTVSNIAQGRGGRGPGKYVWGLCDHSYSRLSGYDEFREAGFGRLFGALHDVAIEQNIERFA
jgi:hypothetical protein